MTEQVSARTMRRHYALLSKVAEKVLGIGYSIQAVRNVEQTVRNELGAARASLEERMERLESHVVMLVGHVERLIHEKEALQQANRTLREAPPLTGWTRDQEAHLIQGLTDAALKRATMDAQREG